MSKSNENNKSILAVHLGSPSADKSIPAFSLAQRMVLSEILLVNGADVAASDTDYIKASLVRYVDGSTGDVEVAELDTRAAHENGLTGLVGKAMNFTAEVDANILEEGDYYFKYDETDTGTAVALTDALLNLTLHQK
jgi:hypothetical protein